MKLISIFAFLLCFVTAKGQVHIDTSKLPLVPYKPKVAINGIIQHQYISLDSLQKYGLQIVLDDQAYKAIQFDSGYDCHSKSLLDFSVIRYSGDKVAPTDLYLRNRILMGDLIDIIDTVIENRGYRCVMKSVSFIIIR